MTTALATRTYLIDIGRGVFVHVTPKRVGSDVLIRCTVNTPFGESPHSDIHVTLNMRAELFETLMDLAAKYRVIPRISDLLEGTFGQRPRNVATDGR